LPLFKETISQDIWLNLETNTVETTFPFQSMNGVELSQFNLFQEVVPQNKIRSVLRCPGGAADLQTSSQLTCTFTQRPDPSLDLSLSAQTKVTPYDEISAR